MLRALSLLGLALALAGPGRAETKPNVILIMADDLGYAELGCYGQKIIRTPHLDRLAAEGLRFTDAYAGNAVCAPSRCVLLTGKHAGHAYVRDNKNPLDGSEKKFPFPGQIALPADEFTLGEALQSHGYATAALGKWGLGHHGTSGDPNTQGFDLFFGYLCQVHAHNHYPKFLWRNDAQVPQEGNTRGPTGARHSQDAFVEEALGFLRAHRDGPFFLYLPFAIPHLSLQTPEKWLAMYRDTIPEEDYKHVGYLKHPFPRAAYAAMVSHMDDGIGQIMALVKELGLDDNTLVLFTSDNGPAYDRLGGSDSAYFQSAGPFRGLKGGLNEGGLRVPLIARWPGKIPPGTASDLPVGFHDVLPTLCEATGAPVPEAIDGLSFLPTLLGKPDTQKKHEYLYWESPGYGGQQALRFGGWKALRQQLGKGRIVTELYHLPDDPGEARDLAAEKPDLVAQAERFFREAHTPSENFPLQTIDGPRKKKAKP